MPPRDARKYLFDIAQEAAQLSEFVSGKSLEDYLGDRLLQRGVERQFEIIGEALSQMSKLDPALAERVSDYRKIISFRNILIHGYADVDDELVWDIVETRLPTLRQEIVQIIADLKMSPELDSNRIDTGREPASNT
ncbi:MAG: DUF86 domain-containing protein [Proteobacteria bacterium]|nr:DUF86 domain-containing protein [Pseudomonadota bacterium]